MEYFAAIAGGISVPKYIDPIRKYKKRGVDNWIRSTVVPDAAVN
jgi:hypothetical protein